MKTRERAFTSSGSFKRKDSSDLIQNRERSQSQPSKNIQYTSFRSRASSSAGTPRNLVLTPENVPEFVIPSLQNYRRRQLLTSPYSCETFMPGERPTTPERRLTYLSRVNEEINRNSESRGSGIGMTLKHMDKTTSSYGYPILTGSPRRCSESIFHFKDRTSQDLESGDSFSLKPRGSGSSFPVSPVLYRNKLKSQSQEFKDYITPEASVPETDTQLAIFEKAVHNRHCISFSSNLSSANDTLNITVQEVRIPSVRKASEVYVRICLHVRGKLLKQFHKSSLQVSTDDIYRFGQTFAFRFNTQWLPPSSVSRIRVCFKVYYQCVKRRSQYLFGKVSVPYDALVHLSHHIHTRCLELTENKTLQLTLVLCYKKADKKLLVTIVKISNLRESFLKFISTRVSVTFTSSFEGLAAVSEMKTTMRKRNNVNGNEEIVFKEAFGFEIPAAKECNRIKTSLAVSVHGRNISFGETDIGSLRFSSDSDDEIASQHWKDVFRNPYEPIKVTHTIHKIIGS